MITGNPSWPDAPSADPVAFRRDYLGDFEPDEHIEQAVSLWRDYYRACEAYDRTVCTGPMGCDGILPANRWEEGLIRAHASRAYRAICDMAEEDGIPSGTMDRAKEIALREEKGR